jgi:hypothetical protein
MTQLAFRPDADAVIAGPASSARLGRRVRGYTACPFRFRTFWGRDYGELTAGSALDWMLHRTPWNATGGQSATLYLKGRPRMCPAPSS